MADQTTPDTIRVYGASDDLIETRGAVDEEFGAVYGGTTNITVLAHRDAEESEAAPMSDLSPGAITNLLNRLRDPIGDGHLDNATARQVLEQLERLEARFDQVVAEKNQAIEAWGEAKDAVDAPRAELDAINTVLRENGFTTDRLGAQALANNYAAAREARNEAEERFTRSQADLGEAVATVEKLKTGVSKQREMIDALGRIAYDDMWGERFPHRGHDDTSGGPDCAGCWADMILQAIGEEPKDRKLLARFDVRTEYQCRTCREWAPWTDGEVPGDNGGVATFWCQHCGGSAPLLALDSRLPDIEPQPLSGTDLEKLGKLIDGHMPAGVVALYETIKRDRVEAAAFREMAVSNTKAHSRAIGEARAELDRLRVDLETKSVVHQCCEDLQALRATGAVVGTGDLADMLDEVLRHVTALPSNMRYRSRLTARQALVKAKTARPTSNDRPAGNVSASKYARSGPQPVSLRDQSRAWLREFQEARRELEGRATLRDVMAAAYRSGLGIRRDVDHHSETYHNGEHWHLREWSLTNGHRREVGRLEIETGPRQTYVRVTGRLAPESGMGLLTDPTPGEVLDAARAAGLITK